MLYTYIINSDYIKNTYGYDFKALLAENKNVDVELKQNYLRLYNYVIAHNCKLRSAPDLYASSRIKAYNKDATTVETAFLNQFLDNDLVAFPEKIEMWQQAQALQAIYEMDNGVAAFNPNSNAKRICDEVMDLLYALDLLWRTESMK